MNFSVIVPIMNKPSLLDFISHYKKINNNIIDQLIVVDFDVDYSRLNHLYQGLDEDDDIIIEVKKEQWFNKSLAINIGVSLICSDNIIICDADVLIQEDTLRVWSEKIDTSPKVISPKYVKETLDSQKRPAPGICCLKRSDFLNVEGYCSDYIGWGFEDHDFLLRLQKSGLETFLYGWGYHLTHDDSERVQNYYSQNKAEMRNRNLNLFKVRRGLPRSYGTFYVDINAFDICENSPTHFIVSRHKKS